MSGTIYIKTGYLYQLKKKNRAYLVTICRYFSYIQLDERLQTRREW